MSRHLAPFSPELCKAQKNAPLGDDWLHETKWDGYRCCAWIVDRDDIRLWSRNGVDWTRRLPTIVEALRSLGARDTQIDGELVVLDTKGHSNFNALQERLGGRNHRQLIYALFDVPRLNGKSLVDIPLIERKKKLQALLRSRPHPALNYSSHVVGHGNAALESAQSAGLEGIVSKRVDSRYRGTRNGDWIKVKVRPTNEFVVVGFTRRGREDISSLYVAMPLDDHLVCVGRVGSGFSAAHSRELRSALEKLRLVLQPSTVDTRLVPADRLDSIRWVKPTLSIDVAHQGLTGSGRLRQPVFVPWRKRP